MLQNKILQFFGETYAVTDITRAFVRYCCRLCSSSGISPLYRLELPSTQRAAIRNLKDWVDNSCYRNTLYLAIWMTTQQRRPKYLATAKKFGIDPGELKHQFHLLSREERMKLQTRPEPKRFNSIQVLHTTKNIERYARYLVRKYLRFCYRNDGGFDREDFWSDLTCQAIKIIRTYEVTGLSVDQMTPLVARGLTNHVKNLAIYYGKVRRNPLLRLEQRTETKEAWYCNVNAETVEHVWVYVAPEYRHGEYFLAEFDDRRPAYIYCRRLFDAAAEADESLRQYRAGRGCARTTVVDLTASRRDDWQPVTASLDTPGQPNGAPLINFIPAPDNTDHQLNTLIEQTTDPKARLFFDALKGDLGPMFDQYCRDTVGRGSAELPEVTLTRAARHYSGISTKQLHAFTI